MSEPVNTPDGDAAPAPRRVLEAIMFTDIAGSVNLEQVLGTEHYAKVLTRHGDLFHEALRDVQAGEIEKHTGDGFMARFTRPSDAVAVALRFQWLLGREAWGIEPPLKVRVGIHQGEILLIPTTREMPGTIGTAVNLAARVMSMATAGQILLTRGVFDNARQFVRTIPGVAPDEQAALGWEAHGAYLVKGIEGPVEIFEVGERGRAPFRRPPKSTYAERSVSAEEEATLGWRPAREMEVPRRSGWFLDKRLGEGGFGEVWLAQNRHTRDWRVFKFCFDAVRLRSFKRELTLFRLIREALGPRQDIATLYEVQLEAPPFFLESEYCAGGILKDWVEEKLRGGDLPLARRLDIVARLARALAAAHSVGIIHKDVKPSNIFIDERPDGVVQPRLADFGIGVLTDPSAVDDLDLTASSGLTMSADPSRTGTRLYSAPEYMVGRPPSIQGDIYSLGVLLFQIVVGDFGRPIGAGWRRDVPDELIAEDIARCVDVDPARRFASALQVAEQLENLDARRAERQAAADLAAHEAQQELELARSRRRVRLALTGGAIGLALIAALTVVIFVLQQARKDALHYAAEIEKEREIARDRLYVADLQGGTFDMVQRRTESVREVINRQRPAPGERDRRGWEWFFADSVLNTSQIVRAVSKLPLRALAVDPTGSEAAVGGDDGGISIWSCISVEKQRGWPAGGEVRSLGWNAAGLLAAGFADGQVALWEAASGQEKKRWKAHDGPVNALVWNPATATLTTGGSDGVVASWDAQGKSIRRTLRQGPVAAMDWRQDGSEIAITLGQPARVFVGREDALDQAHEIQLEIEESAVAWRPNEYEIAVAMNGLPMRSWNPFTCVDSFWLPKHFCPAASTFAWSPTGDRAAVGGVDGKIILPDSQQMKESRVPLHGHVGRVAGLRWLGGKKERLLSIGYDGTLRAWDELRRSPEVKSHIFPTTVTDARWHPQKDQFAVLLAGDEVRVVGAESGEVEWVGVLPQPRASRTPFAGGRLAWSPDGNWLAAVVPGRALIAWRIETGEAVTPPGSDDATDVQWLPDSHGFLVRTPPGWVRLSLTGGAAEAIPQTERATWIGDLADGNLGQVRPANGTLHFFKTGASPFEIALPATLGAQQFYALSPDRSRLAIAGESGAVLWIDTRTGEMWRPALAHSGQIKSLGWHPDGSRLATTGIDGSCRLFNIAQTAQNWVIDHQLSSEVVATDWSAGGRKLLLASQPGKTVKIYDASISIDRESGRTTTPARVTPVERLTQAGARLEQHPEDEMAWKSFIDEVKQLRGGGGNAEADLLLAAAELGKKGGFRAFGPASPPAGKVLTAWQGAPLPRVAQVAQACVLQRWPEVLELGANGPQSGSAAGWLASARAEALAQLNRARDAEAANLAAWQALRREQGARDPATLPESAGSTFPATVDLSAWATARLTEDWNGGENNNLSALPTTLPQPEGYSFHCSDFLQLAGRSFRLSGGRMLPRSTGWIPLGTPAREVSFALTTCAIDADEHLQDTCVGTLFLLRAGGAGAVRIPLIFGRNIWDWWTPQAGYIGEAPPEAVAWRGENPHATFRNRRLALYRLTWSATDGDDPVIAVSVVSHLRHPAPAIMAAEVVK